MKPAQVALASALVLAACGRPHDSDVAVQYGDLIKNNAVHKRLFMWLDQYPTLNPGHMLAGCWYFAEVDTPASLTSVDLQQLFIQEAVPANSHFIPADIIRGQMDLRLQDLDIAIDLSSSSAEKDALRSEKRQLAETRNALWRLPIPGFLGVHDEESMKLLPTTNAHTMDRWDYEQMQTFRAFLGRMDKAVEIDGPTGWVAELLSLELQSCARTPEEKAARGLKAARDPFVFLSQ